MVERKQKETNHEFLQEWKKKKIEKNLSNPFQITFQNNERNINENEDVQILITFAYSKDLRWYSSMESERIVVHSKVSETCHVFYAKCIWIWAGVHMNASTWMLNLNYEEHQMTNSSYAEWFYNQRPLITFLITLRMNSGTTKTSS